MKDKQFTSTNYSPRENFLMSILNKVTKEYKALIEYIRNTKPLKIAEIITFSNIPGETEFAVQLTNKNCVKVLSAGEIISQGYNLNEFSDFHADMIRTALQGKLMEFLKLSEKIPAYRVVAKKFDRELQQYIFTIEQKNQTNFPRTGDEVAKDKNILHNLGIDDVYDIAYTNGCESIIKEKTAIMVAKKNVTVNTN